MADKAHNSGENGGSDPSSPRPWRLSWVLIAILLYILGQTLYLYFNSGKH